VRFIFTGLFSLLFLSCVSTSSQKELREEIVGLDGMAVEFIKTQWGEPDSQVPSADGQRLAYEGIFIKDEDPFTGENADRFCEVKLKVDAEGLVTDWSYEACEFVNKEKKEQVAEGVSLDPEPTDGELEQSDPSADAADPDDKLEMLPLTP
jgi:hypothetical protein